MLLVFVLLTMVSQVSAQVDNNLVPVQCSTQLLFPTNFTDTSASSVACTYYDDNGVKQLFTSPPEDHKLFLTDIVANPTQGETGHVGIFVLVQNVNNQSDVAQAYLEGEVGETISDHFTTPWASLNSAQEIVSVNNSFSDGEADVDLFVYGYLVDTTNMTPTSISGSGIQLAQQSPMVIFGLAFIVILAGFTYWKLASVQQKARFDT